MEYLEYIQIIKPVLHYFLHLIFPGLIAYIFFRKNWKQAWIVMVLTMLVDLDHLLSTPIYDSARCSIGHHLLHSYYMVIIYFILMFIPKTRIIGIGLFFHMSTDFIDCTFSTMLKDIIQ